jgi:hypothetical protein
VVSASFTRGSNRFKRLILVVIVVGTHAAGDAESSSSSILLLAFLQEIFVLYLIFLIGMKLCSAALLSCLHRSVDDLIAGDSATPATWFMIIRLAFSTTPNLALAIIASSKLYSVVGILRFPSKYRNRPISHRMHIFPDIVYSTRITRILPIYIYRDGYAVPTVVRTAWISAGSHILDTRVNRCLQ